MVIAAALLHTGARLSPDVASRCTRARWSGSSGLAALYEWKRARRRQRQTRASGVDRPRPLLLHARASPSCSSRSTDGCTT